MLFLNDCIRCRCGCEQIGLLAWLTVSHIRIFNHYIPAPQLLLSVIELGLLFAAVVVANMLRFQWSDGIEWQWSWVVSGIVYSVVILACTYAMGVYRAAYVDGFGAMVVRTIVAYCLLGCSFLTVFFYLLPEYAMWRGVLLLSIITSLLFIVPFRWVYYKLVNIQAMANCCLVLGTGKRAARLASALESRHPKVANVAAFIQMHEGDECVVTGKVIPYTGNLVDIAREMDVGEIVVAVDSRRESDGTLFPLDDLLECKLSGVKVSEAITFYEREFGILELEEIKPGWMVFTAGFNSNWFWQMLKRFGDIVIALVILLLAWPLMVLAALAILVEDRGPFIYSQTRVGAGGKPFQILKFRSMRVDAEQDGVAVWAGANDDRVTRVGAVLRNTRVDELPQLYNVLRGEMSIVGPRPERPEFVDNLNREIPFYAERHRAKPGLMGWAQLNYPYGASTEDAARKLSYDLYYVKNRSLLLDLIIMVQTVQIILLGTGVR